jgi:cystathionine gamma-synthase
MGSRCSLFWAWHRRGHRCSRAPSRVINPPRDLRSNGSHHPSPPSILALFCEFPSNPLLRSPNLKRLRALADEYNFLIVVDETVGSFVNVHVLPEVDMMATSLTKIFSGDTNVMGGG